MNIISNIYKIDKLEQFKNNYNERNNGDLFVNKQQKILVKSKMEICKKTKN